MRAEEMRGRLRGRGVLGSSQSFSKTRGVRGQGRLGGGALLEEAMKRAETITARIQERKPGVIPMVKEFRPGERIKRILAPVRGSIVDSGQLSVEGEESYPVNERLSVIM